MVRMSEFFLQDVYSTFSSDSGNVADYYEGSERPGPQHLIPKSRSMPDYMENYAGLSYLLAEFNFFSELLLDAWSM